MKLRRKPRRAQPETIVALIDVVFFLLIFFMLIGRMDATAPFQVTPPVAGTGSAMPGGGATLSVGAGGDLALNGQRVQRAGLRQGLTALLTANPDLLVRVNAHRETDLSDLLPLVAGIEAMGARDIVLVVTPGAP